MGSKVSPSKFGEAADQVGSARGSAVGAARANVAQVTTCPWCGEELRPDRVVVDDPVRRRVLLYRPRGEGTGTCPFSRRKADGEGIPMLTVDEEIYRLLPSLLIVTVDKFAPLPWYGQAGLLFGRTTQWCSRHGYRHDDLDKQNACGNWHKARGSRGKDVSEAAPRLRPPDLIIQDELHLISGALGTTVGHFEAAVDQLCTRTWKDEDGAEHQAGPKIVASRHHQARRRPGARRLRPQGRRLPAPWGRGGGRSPHARGWSRAHGVVWCAACAGGRVGRGSVPVLLAIWARSVSGQFEELKSRLLARAVVLEDGQDMSRARENFDT